MAKNSKSIEEQVEDWCKKQFKGQKYYTKTETVNAEIASAPEKVPSKQGGAGKKVHEVDVWYISKDNLFVPKHVGLYDDLSFLDVANTSEFIQKLHLLYLTPKEVEERKQKLEDEIERKRCNRYMPFVCRVENIIDSISH